MVTACCLASGQLVWLVLEARGRVLPCGAVNLLGREGEVYHLRAGAPSGQGGRQASCK